MIPCWQADMPHRPLQQIYCPQRTQVGIHFCALPFQSPQIAKLPQLDGLAIAIAFPISFAE